MAMTKTIQATVKNRTDTAANWTQKNPVLAEGEIIVVQTSAGETRLKIGDGVKTFTQLPYIDEQIYNNVVTSVNGQTGDVILPGDFIVNVTSTDDINCTLDKTFDQIQEAVQVGKKVYAKLNGVFTIYMPMVLYSSFVLIFATTAFTSESIEQYVLAVPMSNSDGNNPQFLKKLAVTYNSDPTTGEKTMPQVDMSEDPVNNMQIATKKYVDNSLWYGADMEMSDTSTHPVRNMVIKKYVDDHVAGSQSLGLKSAAVGQIAKIAAVDASGVPTEWSPVDMPTALPNPNALTFTGAVTSTYDGSVPVTINIPESGAGNMKKLTFTGAVTGEYDGTTDVNVNIPIATTSTAGAIKVGNGLSISADGTLSVTTATYYAGTADPVNTLGADGDLYLKTEG